LDHIKIGLFKIVGKISEVIYRLNLLVKIKIYLVQYIAMLELVHRDLVLLVYKKNTYRGQKKNLFKKIISYKEVNNKI